MTRTPIPNCPQPETPIRDRAWTDEQRLREVIAWFASDDTGMSSEAIACHMTGVESRLAAANALLRLCAGNVSNPLVIAIQNHLQGTAEPVAQGEADLCDCDADKYNKLPHHADCAVLAAQPSAVPPDGWKLVPVEPTDDMLAQACTHDTAPRDAKTDQWNRDTWAFMLAAAPSPGESA